MRTRALLLVLPLLVAACGEGKTASTERDYQALRSSFTAPAGFSPASPAGPCATDEHMKCWTTAALPTAAVKATVAALGADFTTTDTSWCSAQHWGQQRRAWGEAHAPCTLHGTSRGLKVRIEAIAFPDPKKSTPGHLVFPPTLVSISAR